jgi:CDP-diglyceride synthetase
MNELTKRLLTAGALGTLTLYLIFESPLGFTALLVLAVLFGLYEFLKLNNIAVLYKIICASLVLGYGAIVVVGLPTHHPFATLIFPIATLWWLNNFWTVSRYPAVKPDNFFILFYKSPTTENTAVIKAIGINCQAKLLVINIHIMVIISRLSNNSIYLQTASYIQTDTPI